MSASTFKWILYPINQFDECAVEWQSLNTKTAKSPLLDPRFITPLLNYFSEKEMVIAFAYKHEELVIASILTKLRLGQWQTFQPSQAPMGMWLCKKEYFNDDSLASLANALPGLVLTLSITQQDPNVLARPCASKYSSTLDYITTPKLDVPESFDDYWATRSKNVRSSVGKAKRRLCGNIA